MSTHTRLKRVNRLEEDTAAPEHVVNAIFVMPRLTTESDNPEIQAEMLKARNSGFAYILSGPLAGTQVAQEDGESLENFEARVEASL